MTGNYSIAASFTNARVLAEFNSTDVTLEVFWTINSSYMSFVSYNASCVVNDIRRQIKKNANMTVSLQKQPTIAFPKRSAQPGWRPPANGVILCIGIPPKIWRSEVLLCTQIDQNWYTQTHLYPQAAPIIARLPTGGSWGYYVTLEVVSSGFHGACGTSQGHCGHF